MVALLPPDLRLGLSVLAVIGGIVLAVVARSAVSLTEEFFRQHAESDDYLAGGIPAVLVPTKTILRALQLVIVLEVTLLLLAIWGYGHLVELFVDTLVGLVPLLVKIAGTILLLVGLVIGVDLANDRVTTLSSEVNRMGEHEESVLLRVTHLLIFVAIGLATLSLWQFNLGSLLIGAGFLGVIFGMASRHIIASMLSGFVLMFSRPFEVGDWIDVDGVEGTVTDITIMHTILRSFDGENVVIPNDEVDASTVINRSTQGRLRLQLDIGVEYEADFERAKSIALEAVEKVDDVLDAPAPKVVGVEFADSSVVLRLRFWIDSPSSHRRWKVRTDVLQSVKEAFEEAGIDIPYPHREVKQKEPLES